MKFQIYPRDIVAVLVLILLFACKMMGMNGFIDASIALVLGYYFSKRVKEENESESINVKLRRKDKNGR